MPAAVRILNARANDAPGFQVGGKKARLMELRPLGFGEIFDRAVTLYIRNLVPFVSIVLVLVLPMAILQYIMDAGSQPGYDAMIRIFQHPGAARGQHIPTVFDSPATLIGLLLVVALSYTIAPFVFNAVAVGVARLYRGRPVEFRACYDVVFKRWPQILGVVAIEFVIFVGVETALVLIVVGIVLVAFALHSVSAAIVPVAVVVALLLFLVVLSLAAPLGIALAFAMYGVVLEERGVIEALLLGFARIFNRAEFWRAMLFAIAVFAVIFGASTMFGMFAMAAAIFHLPLLEVVIQSLPSAIINPLAVVICAVYYFDVRIRREAFDVEAGLERLAGRST